ncbi:MAG TPA: DUF2065 domain-containing protein [Sutterella sp.]|nr:DUF2065 domain-containing protein [Sutterella sp.]
MTGKVFLLAVAIVAVLEGFFPFVAPDKWLETARKIGTEASPKTVRSVGLFLVIFGVSAIWLRKGF